MPRPESSRSESSRGDQLRGGEAVAGSEGAGAGAEAEAAGPCTAVEMGSCVVAAAEGGGPKVSRRTHLP